MASNLNLNIHKRLMVSVCVCVCRYRYIAVLLGHQATINLQLYLAAPSHRAISIEACWQLTTIPKMLQGLVRLP